MKEKLLLVTAFLFVAGCASSGMDDMTVTSDDMTVTSYDGKTGKNETNKYSKYYEAGDWLIEGKLGIQVVIDHEKNVNPIIHSLQQATASLGPDDMMATGIVTLYFINLETRDVQVEVQSVSNGMRERASGSPQTVVARARARTRLPFGVFPIFNYGTEVETTVKCRLNDASMSKDFIAKRLTYEELDKYFGPSGMPPYPWFEAPYFPFNPPLKVIN